MKILLELMELPEPSSIVISAVKTLSKILISEHMKQCWSNFRELILLRITNCYKTNKEVG